MGPTDGLSLSLRDNLGWCLRQLPPAPALAPAPAGVVAAGGHLSAWQSIPPAFAPVYLGFPGT